MFSRRSVRHGATGDHQWHPHRISSKASKERRTIISGLGWSIESMFFYFKLGFPGHLGHGPELDNFTKDRNASRRRVPKLVTGEKVGL